MKFVFNWWLKFAFRSWLLLTGAVGAFSAYPAPQTEPLYTYRADPDPDGTGKFYMGREIARVMNARGAAWLDRPEREEEEKTSLLLEALEIKPGQVIADVGAGSGYFSFLLAEKTGPQGKVFAIDIQPTMLDLIRRGIQERGIANVEVVLGEEADARLPPASIDFILMVDVYHELSQPWEMMQKISLALKPGGRLVLVEYRSEDPSVPIKRLHKMTEEQVKREMAPHPLVWMKTVGVLPRQHLLVFQKRVM